MYYILEAASAISMVAKPGARGVVWRRHAPVLVGCLTDRGSNTGRPKGPGNQLMLSDGRRSVEGFATTTVVTGPCSPS